MAVGLLYGKSNLLQKVEMVIGLFEREGGFILQRDFHVLLQCLVETACSVVPSMTAQADGLEVRVQENIATML